MSNLFGNHVFGLLTRRLISVAHPLDKAYATQSSLNFQLRPASLAIDEKYHTAMSTSWPISEEARPEWTVELRCEQTIEAVRLWRRGDVLFRKHQENISVKSIPPHTPFLYSKTGVCRGIPILLIFAPKYKLWVLVRTASARRF